MTDEESQTGGVGTTIDDASNHETAPLLNHDRISPLEKYAQTFKLAMYFLLAVNLVWVIVLLVDTFYSLGFDNIYGSGFELFGISLLGLSAMLNALAFYNTPGKAIYIMKLTSVVIIVLDLILILSVKQLRHRIGHNMALGSIGGTALTFLVCAISDHIMGKEKVQEEDEANESISHRFADRLLTFLNACVQLAISLAVICASINFIFDAFDAQSIPLGAKVPVNISTRNSHSYPANNSAVMRIACLPGGNPDGLVAIAETGESPAEEFSSWILRAGNLKYACYWDRPGYGFSDSVPSPASISTIMDLLDQALVQVIPHFSEESLLLVSHGIGNLYSRVYATKRPHQIQGMMLVDPLHEDIFYDSESISLGFDNYWEGVGAIFGIQKLHGLFIGLGSSKDRLIGALANRQSRAHKSLLQQQLSASRGSRLDIETATLKLSRKIPLLVVSSAEMCKSSKRWSEAQHLLLRLSDNALAWKILDGPHEIWRNTKSSDELAEQLGSFAKYIIDLV